MAIKPVLDMKRDPARLPSTGRAPFRTVFDRRMSHLWWDSDAQVLLYELRILTLVLEEPAISHGPNVELE